MILQSLFFFFFFFNDTATTEIYTLSLHDALPISRRRCSQRTRATRGRWLSRQRRYFSWAPSWHGRAPNAGEWRSGAAFHTLKRHDNVRESDPGLPAGAAHAARALLQRARDLGRRAGAHLRAALGLRGPRRRGRPAGGLRGPGRRRRERHGGARSGRRGARLL